jgi:hypothetical protein
MPALLEHPTRALFLSPEIIRGRETQLSERSDHYALGVCLPQCAYRIGHAAEARKRSCAALLDCPWGRDS